MTNLAAALKTEIARLARKQSRAEVESLKKAVSTQRADIAALKRRVQELDKAFKALAKLQTDGGKSQARGRAQASPEAAETKRRFSAKGLASNRQRLGCSAAEFALLIGTTEQSIYAWESGKAQPRAKFLGAIASLRGLGKRAVADRLAQLKPKP